MIISTLKTVKSLFHENEEVDWDQEADPSLRSKISEVLSEEEKQMFATKNKPETNKWTAGTERPVCAIIVPVMQRHNGQDNATCLL